MKVHELPPGDIPVETSAPVDFCWKSIALWQPPGSAAPNWRGLAAGEGESDTTWAVFGTAESHGDRTAYISYLRSSSLDQNSVRSVISKVTEQAGLEGCRELIAFVEDGDPAAVALENLGWVWHRLFPVQLIWDDLCLRLPGSGGELEVGLERRASDDVATAAGLFADSFKDQWT